MAGVRILHAHLEQFGFPNVCICCGAPATNRRQHNFNINMAATSGFLTMGRAVSGNMADAVGGLNKLKLTVPLCDQHRDRIRRPLKLMLALLVGVIVFVLLLMAISAVLIFTTGSAHLCPTVGFGTITLGFWLMLLFIPLQFYERRTPKCSDATSQFIELVNVAPEFAAACPGQGARTQEFHQTLETVVSVRTIVGAAVLLLLCFGGTAMTLFIFFMTGRVRGEVAGRESQNDAVVQQADDDDMGHIPATGQGGRLKNPPRVEGSAASPNTQPTPIVPTNAAEALLGIRSESSRRKDEALNWLARNGADESVRSEVADEVVPILKDKRRRTLAHNILKTWATQDQEDALAEIAQVAEVESDRDLQRVSLLLLSDLKSGKALPSAIAYFHAKHDRGAAEKILTGYGPVIASHLLNHLNEPDKYLRDVSRAVLRKLALESSTVAESIVKQCITDLRSEDMTWQLNSLQLLAKTNVVETLHSDVAKTIEPFIEIDDQQLREAGFAALKLWVSGENVPTLIRLLEVADGSGKKRIESLLATSKDARAVEIIAKGLGGSFFQRTETAGRLRAMGSVAESGVWPFLKHADWKVRSEACEVLKDIGTNHSIAPLQEAAKDTNISVRRKASAAISAVQQSGRVANSTNSGPASAAFRTWTDRTGEFSVEASFIQLKDGKVKLRKKSGEALSLTMNQLSERDQQYVRQQAQSPSP